MINTTLDGIVFNRSGASLDADIRSALERATATMLAAYGMEQIDLKAVTTHTHVRATFAKFVRLRLLRRRGRFGRPYVLAAAEAYRQKHGQITEDQFKAVMYPAATGSMSFKRRYARFIRAGLGLFLIALHSSGAITLPFSFSWPMVLPEKFSRPTVTPGTSKEKTAVRRVRDDARILSSELLSFIRKLDAYCESLSDPAFESIGNGRASKVWFSTYGTKLLLATGWHRPEDVNVADLIAIKKAAKSLNPYESVCVPYRQLLAVLGQGFEGRVSATTDDWTNAAREHLKEVTLEKLHRQLPANFSIDDPDILDELVDLKPEFASIKQIRALTSLPGIDIDVRSLSDRWLAIEETYIEKTPRENYKTINGALSALNMYLFFYLPYWFARNPNTSLRYPDKPSMLIKAAFVSRLLPVEQKLPITFVDFLRLRSKHRNWCGNGHYATLKHIENFFDFIELARDEIPECSGFTQPLSKLDFPRTSSARRTNKQPVPRRFFALFLDYHEALLMHLYVITSRILSGELDAEQIEGFGERMVIDTIATQDLVGFVPVLFTKTKAIPLQIVPNVLDIGMRTIKAGKEVLIPHPHALHENLVALYTGIRHNHIQWLDRDTFDSKVDDEDVDFSRLFVNTDKMKKEPWSPHVNFRVIQLLRAQRGWRDLIEEGGFDSIHFYNNNPATKWAPIRPLFAYTRDGKPHHDRIYGDTWRATLCGFQGLTLDLAEYGHLKPLVTLLPPNHRKNDPKLKERLDSFGGKFKAGEFCPLNIMTEITPHSARVSVVSEYLPFLSADIIGKHITGQKPAAVYYYFHLDSEAVETEQVHQTMRMKELALRNAFEPAISGNRQSSPFIHADDINSRLAQSLKTNLDETLVSYGCINISLSNRKKKGLDVLRETRAANAAL